MQQLASLAGVSVSTVSKAFRDASEISLDTKNKIFEIAKKHGCYGKFYKGKFHKKIFAIIFPEIESAFYSDYVKRLQKIIEGNGGIVLMSTDNFDKQKQSELIDYYASYLNVDGIFAMILKAEIKRGYEIPIVSLMSPNNRCDSVNYDIQSAMEEAINILKQHGHTDIAFIGEELTLVTAKMFCKALKQPFESENIIISKQRFQKAGEDGVNTLLGKKRKYTAIICAYDDIAYGAIRQLKKLGLSVPNDYSVIGIDNINFSEYTETALTTIDCSPEQLCNIAWDIMSKKCKNRYYSNRENIIIPAKLIMRETVSKRK